MRPPAAVASTRVAVRRALADIAPGSLVLAAVSGGPDSMALAAALRFVAPRSGLRAGLLTVDHRLQSGSDVRAQAVADWAESAGFDPVEVLPVTVGRAGGPEAAARTARYTALSATAQRHGAAAVLLGHTRDDQAETVLLGLARGSGARSLAGMAPVRDGFRRPFLDLPRTITAKACADLGLAVWHDPHNDDPRYLRSVVRHRSLPRLESDLGPGVAAALARTAARLRADADALDGWADTVLAGTDPLSVRALAELPSAVRTRVIRRAVVAAGVSASALSAGHVAALDRLVNDWRGQGAVALPGGFVGRRAYGRLRVDGPDGSRPS